MKKDHINPATPPPCSHGYRLLMEAMSHWEGMRKFRSDRARNKRYTYGDQWKDIVIVDGKRMTEEEYIRSQGNVPLKNNLIRRLVTSVLGVWRRQSGDIPGIGDMEELLSRTMEEFLISGLAVHRKWPGIRGSVAGCHTDMVLPDNFFIDRNMRDFRGIDCSCIGEIHDISLHDLLEEFSSNPQDYRILRDIFRETHDADLISTTGRSFGYHSLESCDFLHSPDYGRCRIIELWKKESRSRFRCHDTMTGELYKIEASDLDKLVLCENRSRLDRAASGVAGNDQVPLINYSWMIDSVWCYYFLSPLGHIIRSGESPWSHGGHPYVFKAYPFIDGEIHSFVSDVIDQQRYTNRLITLYDWVMRSSAKGLLLFPENCLPDGMSIDDIADQWSRYNGIVLFKAKAGVAIPQQITNNATSVGITELLNIQLKFFEDISGVNGALQGKLGFAGQSAAHFSQQTENATTTLLDLLASFTEFANRTINWPPDTIHK